MSAVSRINLLDKSREYIDMKHCLVVIIFLASLVSSGYAHDTVHKRCISHSCRTDPGSALIGGGTFDEVI